MNRWALAGLALLLGAAGCDRKSNGIEGRYTEVGHPGIHLLISDGQFEWGGDDINASGTYTNLHKTGENTWEFDVTFEGRIAGKKEKHFIRRDGDFVYARGEDVKYETKFQSDH